MNVNKVKINGMTQPMGCALPKLSVSWQVEDTQAKHQKEAEVVVAADPAMTQVLARVAGQLTPYAQGVELDKFPRNTYYFQVKVTGDNGEVGVSPVVSFDTGKMEEPWQGKWIGTQPQDTFHPVFEKGFSLSGVVRRARLYITGVGLYEASINGKKVGEDYLAPFFNDYNCAIQVQTYDVLPLLSEKNTLSVMTGNGWYKGRLGYEGKSAVYGDKFGCLAELHLEYEDGREEVVVTDESWTYHAGNVTFSDIYDGETLDRLADPGEDKPVVLLAELEGKKLVDRYSMPLKEMETLPVAEVLHTPAGETVLDFGQNFSGFVRFRAHFPKGTEILLEHGEVLQNGNFYHDNYRTAKTEFRYISGGEEEWVNPRFTYCGFRYVKVTGWPGELDPKDFVGVALYSAMDQTGYLETGHEKVNRLISNALWGLKSNFLDMPTDCPQRDERLGWTGDAQVFTPTASFFMDTRAFYHKFLWDMRNDQVLRDGAIAFYLPNINQEPGGSTVWGDAATFIPDTLYHAFGDPEALREAYPMMRDWVEWLRGQDEGREGATLHILDTMFSFGDWLAMDGISDQSFKGGTEDGYVSSVYYYASTVKVAQAARILGLEEDAKHFETLAEEIRQAILHEYFTPSGRLAMDTQTGYIIALYFGVYRDKGVLLEGLKKRLKKDCYRIKGGFVGAPLMCETLAANGMGDMAFRIFLNEEFPSWLHCVNLGATTIWERWNSVLDDGSISGTGMNSLNHYSFGSVIHYAVEHVAGLRALSPGYAKVRIAPQINAKLGHINCTYHSVSGTYQVSWKLRKSGRVELSCTVPFNCTAELVLPGGDGAVIALEPGTYHYDYQPQVDYTSLLGWNSTLEECVKMPQAAEILQKKLPIAYGMAMSGDKESLGLTLEELKFSPWFGFTAPEVEEAARDLFTVKAELE